MPRVSLQYQLVASVGEVASMIWVQLSLARAREHVPSLLGTGLTSNGWHSGCDKAGSLLTCFSAQCSSGHVAEALAAQHPAWYR